MTYPLIALGSLLAIVVLGFLEFEIALVLSFAIPLLIIGLSSLYIGIQTNLRPGSKGIPLVIVRTFFWVGIVYLAYMLVEALQSSGVF